MLFLSPTGSLGGAERVLLAVLAAVRERWPERWLHLITLTDGPLVAAARKLDVETTVLPLPPALARFGDSQFQRGAAYRHLRLAGQALAAAPDVRHFHSCLRRVLRSLQPDVIHSNGIKTHVLASLARPTGVPVVWHVHEFYGRRPLTRRCLPWLQNQVAAALAISAAVGRDVQALLPRVPLHVIPNGVDNLLFAPGRGDGDWLDRLAGLVPAPPPCVRIGLVATYARWKGHAVFLEALGRLRAAHGASAVRAYVIGGPIYQTHGSQMSRTELEELARGSHVHDCVGFVPFQMDMPDIYRALDVVVHASTQPEPFGLTIVEGMACGKPVVVSLAGGATEIVSPNHDGLGVPPNDPTALAEALHRLAQDGTLRQRLGTAARQTVAARFTQARFARSIGEFYENLGVRRRSTRFPSALECRLNDTRP